MSTFQIVVLGIFSSLIIIGIGVFAAFGGLLGGASTGPVVIWGTLDQQTVEGVIDELHSSDKAFEDVTYVQKDATTFHDTLVNAMASGAGPDLFIIPADDLQSFSDKILTIPYNIVPQATYENAYIDEAELFLTPQGELALPFTIDPLVMYWNRDLFAAAGIASPPQYWNDFLTVAPKITSLDAGSNVKKSAVALGQWGNIPTAKAILSTLFIQAGDNIVERDSTGAPEVVFGRTPDNAAANPAESALRFYTDFANPTKQSYSWNRALPSAPDMFAAGDLAAYFGFASEYNSIATRNPNLRFGVALMPQIQGNSTQVTYGTLTGLAIPRTAKNVQGAVTIAEKLSGKEAIGLIAGALSQPPVRRDVVVDTTGSAVGSVFVQSSLIAHGWLEPSPAGGDDVFQTMIESVVSGKSAPASAVAEGAAELNQLFPRQQSQSQ